MALVTKTGQELRGFLDEVVPDTWISIQSVQVERRLYPPSNKDSGYAFHLDIQGVSRPSSPNIYTPAEMPA